MILVDSTVWIDYFRGDASAQADKLDPLLGTEPIATGDLKLTEVLQGLVSDQDFNQAKKLLTSLVVVDQVGEERNGHQDDGELSCAEGTWDRGTQDY